MTIKQEIDKRIHYCWLSDEPIPDSISECMETWRSVLPNYEIVRWDSRRFDLNSVRFVREACEKRKWAFASDYIRLYAVYSEGGIYLDSDVKVFKPFDDFLRYDMFIPLEYHPSIARAESTVRTLDKNFMPIDKAGYISGIGLQAAIFGARKHHPFLKKCMAFYEKTNFINEDGTLHTEPISPGIYAKTAESLGFRYQDEPQALRDELHVLPSKYFASTLELATEDAYAAHCCAGSWRDKAFRKPTLTERLRRKVSLIW